MSNRLLILSFLISFSLKSYAQVPERKALGLIHKITATWCTPCGTWGWTLAEELMEQTSEEALFLGLYASSSQAKRNGEFYNETAATLASAFGFSGYPSFGINGAGRTEQSKTGVIDAESVKTLILKTADSFANVDPLASAAGSFSLHGDQLKVSASLRFWQAAEGQFYLAAYIVEDNTMNLQSGRSLLGDEVAHHDVLRASMSAKSAWGEQVVSGRLLEMASYTKDFFFKVTDPKWNKANLKVYLVIWKKEQNRFTFINAAVAENQTQITNLEVFPNPTTDIFKVKLISGQEMDARLSIFDISGREVLGPVEWPLAPGSNQHPLDVSWLRPGAYIIRIASDNGLSESVKIIRH